MQTRVVLAMSADGKIADRARTAARFGSPQDQAHLQEQVAWADGVLFGAGTLRAYHTTLSVRRSDLLEQRRSNGQPDQPIQIVCARQPDFDLGWRFFSQPVPRWLLTTPTGQEIWQPQVGFDRLIVDPQGFDWPSVFAQLEGLGIRRLAVLGGGQLVGGLFEAKLVDELWLTLCPLILGGRTAPTPVEGTGFLAEVAPQLELLEVKPIDSEVFLHYRVKI